MVRDNQHGIYTVRYDAVNAMLLNEFLKQHRQVQAQAAEIEARKQSVTELKATLAQLNRKPD